MDVDCYGFCPQYSPIVSETHSNVSYATSQVFPFSEKKNKFKFNFWHRNKENNCVVKHT